MFRAAMRHAVPRRPRSARVASVAASVGPPITSPAKATNVAAPVSHGRFPRAAATVMAAAPMASSAQPATRLRRLRALLVGSPSRSASTGDTRIADRAGATAAATVTITPTDTAARTVRGSMVAVVVGISSPMIRKAAGCPPPARPRHPARALPIPARWWLPR